MDMWQQEAGIKPTSLKLQSHQSFHWATASFVWYMDVGDIWILIFQILFESNYSEIKCHWWRTKDPPTAMLLDEQVGWTFHRVCMKEASTWMLSLEFERCWKGEADYTWLKTENDYSCIICANRTITSSSV